MATKINARLRHKRGTRASMPTLVDGQLYLCTDTHEIYKGTSTGENTLVSDINKLNVLYNENILINGQFKVNQRGLSVYNTTGFSVDMWYHSNGENTENTLTIKDNCVTLIGKLNSLQSTLGQPLEHPNNYLNKYLTFSIGYKVKKGVDSSNVRINGQKVKDNNVSFIFNNELICDGQYHEKEVTFILNDTSLDKLAFNVGIQKLNSALLSEDVEIDIYYMKLEHGKKATPCVNTQYATELAKCQRYYQVINCKMDVGGSIGVQSRTDNVTFTINLPTPMRTLPTMTFDKTSESGIRFIYGSNVHQSSANRIDMISNKQSTNVSNLMFAVVLSSPTSALSNGWVDDFILKLDSNIY